MIKQQTSNEYGISQELLVLSVLANYGIVSIPYGNSARYDCILEVDKKFLKIQIKSLNMLNEDTIVIPMKNNRMSGTGTVTKEYTSEDVNYIAIYYNNSIYLFNPDLARSSFTVRVNKPIQDNQHWIEDYEISKVLDITIKSWVSLKEETRIKEGQGQKHYKCIDCGEPVWSPKSRCVSCARIIQSANSSKPSREILKEEIKNNSFVSLGAKYGVTDNAVRKWCKTYNLPFRVKDIHDIIKKGEWETI